MSDLAEFWTRFRGIGSASVDWDLASHMVFVSFTMDGAQGTMRLRMRPIPGTQDLDRAFRRRLWAAAVSDRGGSKPRDWNDAMQGLRGKVRAHALALLTDTKAFELVRLRWQDLQVG